MEEKQSRRSYLLRLEPSMMAQLKREAKRSNLSMNAVVARALANWFVLAEKKRRGES